MKKYQAPTVDAIIYSIIDIMNASQLVDEFESDFHINNGNPWGGQQ